MGQHKVEHLDPRQSAKFYGDMLFEVAFGAKRERVPMKPVVSIHVPLHFDPNDDSSAANRKRYDLAMAMMKLNPKGFRTPSKRMSKNSWTRIAAKAFGVAQ